MSQPVNEYITARIGQTWTVEDAAYVADKIRQIEEVAEGIVKLNQDSRKSNAFARRAINGALGMSQHPGAAWRAIKGEILIPCEGAVFGSLRDGDFRLSSPQGNRSIAAPGRVEQLSRVVAPRRWREVYLSMFTACFDGAGKDHSDRIVVVAGFGSFSKVWEEFESLWAERLTKDNLPYFHAGQFAHSTGPFVEWKSDEKRRKSLTADLVDIIRTCGLRKFGSMMRVADWQILSKKRRDSGELSGWPNLDAFSIAAMSAVEDLYCYAKQESIKSNVQCVFEKGDPEDCVRRIFSEQGMPDPYFTWAAPHVDRKGIAHDPFIGLQAAGWVAYEYFLDSDRVMHGQPSDRWARREFDLLPGNISFKVPCATAARSKRDDRLL